MEKASNAQTCCQNGSFHFLNYRQLLLTTWSIQDIQHSLDQKNIAVARAAKKSVDDEWEGSRENRVSSWRDFQKHVGAFAIVLLLLVVERRADLADPLCVQGRKRKDYKGPKVGGTTDAEKTFIRRVKQNTKDEEEK